MILGYWKKADHYFQINITKDGSYSGIGRFCDTWEEMIDFCVHYKVDKLIQRSA